MPDKSRPRWLIYRGRVYVPRDDIATDPPNDAVSVVAVDALLTDEAADAAGQELDAYLPITPGAFTTMEIAYFDMVRAALKAVSGDHAPSTGGQP